ncbi:MAG: YdcF family protein, partial [Gammaproteobacteria bacterium]|nr:YdcF family protein [Gammaproteobacteria bacterium]
MDIDVGTRAILKLVLLPPGSLLLLLLIGWIFARRFFGRLLILMAILAFYALSTPVVLDLLASQIETVPALTPTQLRNSRAGAILVFLADTRRHNPELGGADALGPMSLERVDYALRLHRKTGLPIILSGG